MPVHRLRMDLINSKLSNNIHIDLCLRLSKQLLPQFLNKVGPSEPQFLRLIQAQNQLLCHLEYMKLQVKQFHPTENSFVILGYGVKIIGMNELESINQYNYDDEQLQNVPDILLLDNLTCLLKSTIVKCNNDHIGSSIQTILTLCSANILRSLLDLQEQMDTLLTESEVSLKDKSHYSTIAIAISYYDENV